MPEEKTTFADLFVGEMFRLPEEGGIFQKLQPWATNHSKHAFLDKSFYRNTRRMQDRAERTVQDTQEVTRVSKEAYNELRRKAGV